MNDVLQQVKDLLVKAGIEGVDGILDALGAVDTAKLSARTQKVITLRLQGKRDTTEYEVAMGDLVNAVCDAMLEAEARVKARWQQMAKDMAAALVAGFVSGILQR